MHDDLKHLFEIEPFEELEGLSKAELIKRVRFLKAGNELFQETILDLKRRIEQLKTLFGMEEQERLKIAENYFLVRNELYGASSERRKKDIEEEKERQTKEGRPKVQKPSLRFPKLDMVVSRLDFEKQPQCPCCQSQMVKMRQVESSEHVEVVTRRFFVKRLEREKYRCPTCHGSIQTAPLPMRLNQGGAYSDDFAVEATVGKYADHLPMERQVKQMHRQGLAGIDGKTLIEQTHHLAEALRPVYRAILGEVQQARVLQSDETPWRMLEGHPKEKWWLWGFFTKTAAFYKAVESRSGETPNRILEQSNAEYLVVDGYTGYNAGTKQNDIKIVHCWAHARRKFYKAQLAGSKEADYVLDKIAELYRLEKGVDDNDQRHRLRQNESKQVIVQIRDWIYTSSALPSSSLGKATDYLKKYWEGLTRFLEDPELPLDNNLSERELRGPVLGRKNFYGNHSQRGAETSAILYSICESCKLNRVDPHQYLKDAIRRHLINLPPVTPKRFSEQPLLQSVG